MPTSNPVCSSWIVHEAAASIIEPSCAFCRLLKELRSEKSFENIDKPNQTKPLLKLSLAHTLSHTRKPSNLPLHKNQISNQITLNRNQSIKSQKTKPKKMQSIIHNSINQTIRRFTDPFLNLANSVQNQLSSYSSF